MKTLVLGLGNPILSDDGVGIRVAREIERQLSHPDVVVAEAGAGGLDILDLVIGYDQVIMVDAIQTKGGKAGEIHHLEPDDFSFAKHVASPHSMNLITALEVGKKLNLAMPRNITIIAIEASDVSTFREECTPEVEAVIPDAVKMVLSEISAGSPS